LLLALPSLHRGGTAVAGGLVADTGLAKPALLSSSSASSSNEIRGCTVDEQLEDKQRQGDD
jgi:hypothetical protein